MKKITIEERMLIQACLTKRMSLTEIATRLKRNKSSISREISKHVDIKDGYALQPCIHEKEYFVCNICPVKNGCKHKKRFYNFELADFESKNIRKLSRAKTKLTKEQIKVIDQILILEIRELRQSIHHVYVANPVLKTICAERTIRRLIYRNELTVKAHELRRYVTYKHDYEKSKNFQLRDIRVLVGRQFSDYLNYVTNHKRQNIVQYDSVVGKKPDKYAILTITFAKYSFQFGILIEKNNPNDVRVKLKRLFKKLGDDVVKNIFPINLADNGVEFSYFSDIETNNNGEKLVRTYYTNPYKATDKPHCERNHEYIRYFIPKGKSLDFLTQDKVNWMFSQINSCVRKSKNDKTPYELIERKFGKTFLDIVGIKKVEKKRVTLTQIC